MTTLRELITAHPDRFHPQTWYADEPFMDFGVQSAVRLPSFTTMPRPNGQELPRAAMLAQLFLMYPHADVWTKYLWCKDTDRLGQRVYVGNVCEANGHRLEVHRHLAITDRWGVATW